MSEVKQKARAQYCEREPWNNIWKQNSFQDRLLNIKSHKINKDESIVLRAWDSEQLLMFRKKKRLKGLLNSAEASKKSIIHERTMCHYHLPETEHFPSLTYNVHRTDRPVTVSRTMACLAIPSSLSPDRRCQSQSDLSTNSKGTSQEYIALPLVSGIEKSDKTRRSSHSAHSLRMNSLSETDLSKQRLRKMDQAKDLTKRKRRRHFVNGDSC